MAVIGYFAFWRAPPEERLPPFKGSIDIRLWEAGNKERADMRLNKEGALPLKPGDFFLIEARLNRPGYMYILWIDTLGKVVPIYPWKPGHWEERPAEEKPTAWLDLPEDDRPHGQTRDKGRPGWAIDPESAPGMETLVLLVRETPLPRGFELQKLLAGLPRQKLYQRESAVWFENGAVVRNEAKRAPKFDLQRIDDAERTPSFDLQRIDDPVLRTQRLLQGKLSKDFSYSRAVSFANQGKRKMFFFQIPFP
jgi:hypothetical protein